MPDSHFLSLFSCRFPVIQAPMAGVQDSELTIAVCRAGGLGSLPCAMLTLEQIEREIKYIQAETSAAFNVNFFAHQQLDYTDVLENQWYEVLAPYYREFNLDKTAIIRTGARQPFTQELTDLIVDLKVPVVSFHFGLPDDNLLAQIKNSGAKVLCTATTITEAKWLQAKKVDAIIAQGLEAGGHRGMFLSHDISAQLGTFSLVPQLAQACDVPIIAAGGISDASTVEAAFALGADAVQVGTAFLLADEAKTTSAHKAALQSQRAEHTALTNVFSGGVARGIQNRFIAELGIHPKAPPFPYASFVTEPLKQAAQQAGRDDFSAMWAGQNARLAQSGTAKAIMMRLLGQFVPHSTKK